jgi:hypothetical protein
MNDATVCKIEHTRERKEISRAMLPIITTTQKVDH